jgi:glycosyl-4,4'-diaponeurosporenoate acyltransferase
VSLRAVHLSDPVTVVLDVAAWAVVHAGSGYLVHRLPVAWLERDRWLLRERRWEGGGRLYRRTLRIHRWKDRVPEAGALFAGGVSKRHVTSAAGGGPARFVVETRRAELGHWLAIVPAPLFALWNPPGVAVVMVVYALAVNLPFVAIQRYNRIRSSRVLRRSARSRSARGTRGRSIP